MSLRRYTTSGLMREYLDIVTAWQESKDTDSHIKNLTSLLGKVIAYLRDQKVPDEVVPLPADTPTIEAVKKLGLDKADENTSDYPRDHMIIFKLEDDGHWDKIDELEGCDCKKAEKYIQEDGISLQYIPKKSDYSLANWVVEQVFSVGCRVKHYYEELPF